MELSGSIMCFVQEFNNVALEERCDGLTETYIGGEVVRFREEIGITQPAEAISLISGALEGGEYAAVVTLDPGVGLFAVDAARAAQVEVVVTTFDVLPEVLEAIREGDLAFTVDQQPYLQGYQSVQLLIEHLRDGKTPEPGNPTETGPFFVDNTNVDLVEEEAKAIAERLEARFFSS
jgi:simple sugar transport system substrate-binding protein